MICFTFSECLFGKAPFASDTFRELSEKLRDSRPVQVENKNCLIRNNMVLVSLEKRKESYILTKYYIV